MTSNTTPSALIIGATGGIGGEMALALIARGWAVKALNRNPVKAANASAHLGPVEWVKGDAMKAVDVIAAAKGVDVVFHGANPPGYKNWQGTVVQMLDSSIARLPRPRRQGRNWSFPARFTISARRHSLSSTKPHPKSH